MAPGSCASETQRPFTADLRGLCKGYPRLASVVVTGKGGSEIPYSTLALVGPLLLVLAGCFASFSLAGSAQVYVHVNVHMLMDLLDPPDPCYNPGCTEARSTRQSPRPRFPLD